MDNGMYNGWIINVSTINNRWNNEERNETMEIGIKQGITE